MAHGYYLDQPTSPIQIDPAHRGKFTEWCKRHGFKSVQAGAKHVMANKDHYSAEVVKMANFAKNAKHWGHGSMPEDADPNLEDDNGTGYGRDEE